MVLHCRFAWFVLVGFVLTIFSCAATGSRVISITHVDFNGLSEITGQVIYDLTGEALERVQVRIVGTGIYAATDSDGHYRLREVPPGVYTIKAALLGFTSEEHKGLLVGRDSLIVLNMSLHEYGVNHLR